MPPIPQTLRQQVFAEANHRCEYCRTSRRLIGMPLVVDHIIPINNEYVVEARALWIARDWHPPED